MRTVREFGRRAGQHFIHLIADAAPPDATLPPEFFKYPLF